jgi:hypothetical protein
MKTKLTLAAFAVIVISLSSCRWFSSDKKSTNPLVGKWIMDSVDLSKVKDGSSAVFVVVLYKLLDSNKNKTVYEFTDSNMVFSWDVDSTKKSIDQYLLSPDQRVLSFIGNAKDTTQYVIKQLTPDSLVVSSNNADSITAYLVKRK